jgi:CubicO group peptidase (beta-lactamase class C family)
MSTFVDALRAKGRVAGRSPGGRGLSPSLVVQQLASGMEKPAGVLLTDQPAGAGHGMSPLRRPAPSAGAVATFAFLSALALATAGPAVAQQAVFSSNPILAAGPTIVRCGETMPQKQAVERTTANLDTARFFERIARDMDGKFKGYAVIFTGAAGKRLGFRRAGWAVDPCEPGMASRRFDLNTETAIGSVTKLLTTVAVLKARDHVALGTPMTAYLPFRWKAAAHPYYDTVTIADLLQHKAGFRRSGGGEHVASRLAKGRELDTPRGTRDYSNSSMGVFHFIYARYGFRAPYHQTEVAFQNASANVYNAAIQERTSHFYNVGLYNHIFRPLRISATCDPRTAQFPIGRSEYFFFHQVARSYAGLQDGRGRLLPDTTMNCASGGVYLSAKDLARFMTALDDPGFLSPAMRNRMIHDGPEDDLYGFWAKAGAEGGRSFVHNGLRNVGGDVSVAQVVRFPSGAHAVFVANSDFNGVDTAGSLIAAYNAARRG